MIHGRFSSLPSPYFVAGIIARPRTAVRLIGAADRRQAMQLLLDGNVRINLRRKNRLKVEQGGFGE